MKILGEKSLSSKVIVGLKLLFVLIACIDFIVLNVIIKSVRDIFIKINIQNNIFNLILAFSIILTGIIALLIIYQFIKIFKNLKKNLLFCQENSSSLNIVSNSCFVISILYLIISIIIIVNIIINGQIGEFITYILLFSMMFTVIFVVTGIGIKILNEIYMKAIDYKKENDFTV